MLNLVSGLQYQLSIVVYKMKGRAVITDHTAIYITVFEQERKLLFPRRDTKSRVVAINELQSIYTYIVAVFYSRSMKLSTRTHRNM